MEQDVNRSRLLFMADDDDDDRLMFAEALSELDSFTTLILTENGQKLMELLNSPLDALPEALFLDINMPIMDGYECLSRIRGDVRFDSMPIIMLSTCNRPESMSKSFELGANFYAVKPSAYKELKSLIVSVLKKDWSYPGLKAPKK